MRQCPVFKVHLCQRKKVPTEKPNLITLLTLSDLNTHLLGTFLILRVCSYYMINIETCFLLHILFISKQVAEIRHFLQETLNIKIRFIFLFF